LTFGVMSNSITDTSITDGGARYIDLHTYLRENLRCSMGLNLDGGGSVRFRNTANTVQVGARDVVCMLTHQGLV